MEINKKSWMVWLVKSTFNLVDWKLPKSLCTFFWTLVGAIVLQPFCWFQTVLNLFSKEDPDDGLPVGFSIVMSVFIYIFAVASLLSSNFPIRIEYTSIFSLVVAYGVGVLSMICIIALISLVVGVTKGAQWVWYRVANLKQRIFPQESYTEKKQEPSVVWEFIKAKKRKICPLITYKEN